MVAGEAARIAPRIGQGGLEEGPGRRARATGFARTRLGQVGNDETAALEQGVGIAGGVDQGALAREDVVAGRGEDRGAGDALDPVGGEIGAGRIEAVGHVEGDREGRVAGAVVRRAVLQPHLDQAELGIGGEQAGGDPAACGVDHRGVIGHRGVASDGNDVAVADDDGSVVHNARIRVGDHAAIGDRIGLGRGGRCQRQASGQDRNQLFHYCSPSPGWPSMKSRTGWSSGLRRS